MKHTPGGVWVLVSVLIVIMSSCTPPTQPTVEQIVPESDEEPIDEEPQIWHPQPLHVYTFDADLSRDELAEDEIRHEWQFSESDYHDMLRRVRATIDSHNRNNPGDELQVIAGGL